MPPLTFGSTWLTCCFSELPSVRGAPRRLVVVLDDALLLSVDFGDADLSCASVPDATTALAKVRRPPQVVDLAHALLDEINASLLRMRAGGILDWAIIVAPSSTKSECQARDPQVASNEERS
jgi:hypothetical protein